MFFPRLMLLAAIIVGAIPAPSQQSPGAADAIANLRTTWAKDLHDKRLDQIVQLYAPDAVFLPPNGARITGRDAIRDLTKQAMDAFTSDLTFQSMNFDSSGTLAYDSGEYRETLTSASDNSVSHGQGNYLMVFKRQPNGSWLIVQQVWTSLPIAQPSQGLNLLPEIGKQPGF